MKKLVGCVFLIACICMGCSGTQTVGYLNTTVQQNIGDDIDSNYKLKIENISDKISPINTVIKKFDTIEPIEYKTQFETDLDFYKREGIFLNNPIFQKSIYVQNSDSGYSSFEHITYDIYSKRFIFKVQSSSSRIENNYLQYETLPFIVELRLNAKVTGSYTGVNAFGVSAKVTKFKLNKTILHIINKDDLINNRNTTSIENNFPTAISGKSIEIAPQEAQRINSNLKIVYEFLPYPHYINKNKFGIITRNESYEAPKLSSPDETLIKTTVLFVKLIAIHLVDKKTGIVYGSEYF